MVYVGIVCAAMVCVTIVFVSIFCVGICHCFCAVIICICIVGADFVVHMIVVQNGFTAVGPQFKIVTPSINTYKYVM